MTPSWAGVLVTFQVTFTELFIAATVIAAGARRYGWRSSALGLLIGALAVAVLALVLQEVAYRFALHWLDWISAGLLLLFGAYLIYEFIDGLRRRKLQGATSAEMASAARVRTLSLVGVGVAAWALIAEGLEILVVWLGISLRQGAGIATLGVAIGLVLIGVIAVTLGRLGIFQRVPGVVLDGIAAVMVSLYGLYFLSLAIDGM